MAMKCPKCGADSDVQETRTLKSSNVARRTYKCYGCPKTKEVHMFNTHETIVGGARLKPERKKDK